MTSTKSVPRSKKRKHPLAEDVDAITKGMKEKYGTMTQPSSEEASASQKSQTKSLKGKAKVDVSDSNEFRLVNASIVLSVPPVFTSDLRAGVEEMLDSMVMRYIPSLQGVLLAHSNVRFLGRTASINGDCPFAVCNVSFDATVWGPQVSMKLVGKVNLCSPDHISLLVHRTFNVSIPRHHIPQDQWLFEYGPAENDPEFGRVRDWGKDGEPMGAKDREGNMEMNDSLVPSGESENSENSGYWVHHLTGSKLGDPGGYVEFTVIGLTVANEMLSLQGSIQPNPFSPEHVPQRSREPPPNIHQDETPEFETCVENKKEEVEVEDGGDKDEFKHLGKLADEAEATHRAKKRAKEGVPLDRTKKRKLRESHDKVAGQDSQHGKRADRKRTKENAI